MSLRTLPLLYLNLGGEMMYVLDQRLMAQNVPGSKAVKVLDDIASTMFNRKFIDEIFLKHQALYNKRILRAMFDKLAHASIMRLNSTSMDKLYDLMIMAVKYQVLMCSNPKDLVMITLNHLDAIMDYAKNPMVKKNIEMTYELLLQSYCTLSVCEMQSIRYSMLNFLQDLKIRVSIFLSEEKQHSDGTFLYGPVTQLQHGTEKPGQIRFYGEDGQVEEEEPFDAGQTEYKAPEPQGGLGLHETGNRGTKLGLNMYANTKIYPTGSEEEQRQQQQGGSESSSSARHYLCGGGGSSEDSAAAFHMDGGDSSKLAKEELNLLAKLIGGNPEGVTSGKDTFKLSLFDNHEAAGAKTGTTKTSSGDAKGSSGASATQMKIDLKTKNRKGKEITEIMGEMKMKSEDGQEDTNAGAEQPANDEEDLLALMDQAK